MSKRVKKPKFSTIPKKLAQLYVHDVRVFAAVLDVKMSYILGAKLDPISTSVVSWSTHSRPSLHC